MVILRGNNFGCNVSNIHHETSRITRRQKEGWLLEMLLLLQNTYFSLFTLCFSLSMGQCRFWGSRVEGKLLLYLSTLLKFILWSSAQGSVAKLTLKILILSFLIVPLTLTSFSQYHFCNPHFIYATIAKISPRGHWGCYQKYLRFPELIS